MVVFTLPTFHFSNFVLNFLIFDQKCAHRLLKVLFVPNDKLLFRMEPLVTELNNLSRWQSLIAFSDVSLVVFKFWNFQTQLMSFCFLQFFSLTAIMSLSNLCRGNVQNAWMYAATLYYETWKTRTSCLAIPTTLMHYALFLQNLRAASRTCWIFHGTFWRNSNLFPNLFIEYSTKANW